MGTIPSNIETDAELRVRTIEYILREICRKFREKNDPSFTPEEIEDALRAVGANYLRGRMREILLGHGLLQFNDDGSLRLTAQGREHCKNPQ